MGPRTLIVHTELYCRPKINFQGQGTHAGCAAVPCNNIPEGTTIPEGLHVARLACVLHILKCFGPVTECH